MWEYKVLGPESVSEVEAHTELLNQLGALGWELVSASIADYNGKVYFYLKRKINK